MLRGLGLGRARLCFQGDASFLKPTCLLLLLLLLIQCVSVCVHMYMWGIFWDRFSPSTIWFPGNELVLSGLGAGTSVCEATLCWSAESFGREEGWLSYGGIEHSFNPKPMDKGLILAAWSLRLHVFLLLLQGLSVDAAQQGRLSVKPQQCRIYKSQTETGTRIVVVRVQRVQLGSRE